MARNQSPKQRILAHYPKAYCRESLSSGAWRAATDIPGRVRFIADADTPRQAWAALADAIWRKEARHG